MRTGPRCILSCVTGRLLQRGDQDLQLPGAVEARDLDGGGVKHLVMDDVVVLHHQEDLLTIYYRHLDKHLAYLYPTTQPKPKSSQTRLKWHKLGAAVHS